MPLSSINNSPQFLPGSTARVQDTGREREVNPTIDEARPGRAGRLIEAVDAVEERPGSAVGQEPPAPSLSLQPLERISPSPSSFRAAIALYTDAQNLPTANSNAIDEDPAQSLVGVDLFV